MTKFTLSATQAQLAVANIETVGNYKDDAMVAFVNLYGAAGVDTLYADPGSSEHDDAWNALGALEFHAKEAL